MLPYTIPDAELVFKSAPNINAAVKNFLKKEAQNNLPAIKFAKQLRDAALSSQPQVLGQLLRETIPEHEIIAFVVTRYAYGTGFDQIINQVIEKYADSFNATYKLEGEKFTFVNQDLFNQTIKEVVASVRESLKQGNLPTNNFMVNAIMVMIFEPEVLKKVLETMKTIG